MEINRKILRIGIMIIGLCLIFSLGLSLTMKLDRPVFLKNYIESIIVPSQPSYKRDEFVLKYITNISDKRRIVDISFEEYPDLVIFAGSNSSGRDFPIFPHINFLEEEVYGRYAIQNLYVTIDGRSLGEFDEIELNNAKITFDNGELMDIDLGRIIIFNYDYDNRNQNREHFKGGSSGSSSDGTSYTEMRVTEDITVTGLESSLLKEMDDLVEIKIKNMDYKDISEIQYKDGDIIRIDSAFHQSKDILNKFTIYNVEPKLYYKDSNGNSFYRRIYNIGYIKYDFNTWDIIKYLRARGEI